MNGPHVFKPDWPMPDERLLSPVRHPAPALDLAAIFGARWGDWIARAAQAKSAPPDYVVAALLATASTAIGNTRWVSPSPGWAEPPVLWTMAIGAPSSNKSPGLDAVLSPLKDIERELRTACEGDLAAWRDRAEVAKLAESTWKEAAKAALKDGTDVPPRPDTANPGPEPMLPRLSISDSTVERLGMILANQPRGTLNARDELAGWLQGMTRYANGGSDKPFWLEAYGGRSYTVERVGRDPLHIERLSLGVTGGIQPDRLRSLLLKADDDGLLARFLPFWPDPAPITRAQPWHDQDMLHGALARLYGLKMHVDEQDIARPWRLYFNEEASEAMLAFRHDCRAAEQGIEGLLLSFIGKLSGMAARLALVLTLLDWSLDRRDEPMHVTADAFARAVHFLQGYAVPMARRAYAEAAIPKTDQAARRIIAALRDKNLTTFTARDLQRMGMKDLHNAAEVGKALATLEEADIVRPVAVEPNPMGGRPSKTYLTNPLAIAFNRP